MHKRIPFFRIVCALLCGISLDTQLFPTIKTWFSVLAFILIVSVVWHRSSPGLRWKYNWVSGLCMVLILTSIGGISNALRSNSRKPVSLVAGTTFLFKITEGPKKTPASRRYIASCFQTDSNSVLKQGNAYLYFSNTDTHNIKAGDLLFTTVVPNRIRKNSNPGAFDFATYSLRNGIHFSAFMGLQQYVKIGASVKPVDKAFHHIRQKILSIIRRNIKNKQHAGFAEAILIGYREDLDKNLLTAYTNTGVVHIIAISGLHLGVIFMLIDLLVRTLAGKKRSAFAGLFISLPLLWAFAVLTGSSASVIRSTMMFSLLIIGNAMGKKNSGMNSLLGSAVILLMWNPDILFDIGFQLSYAAVASILLFDQQIKKSIYLKNKIALYFWSMISITLAAQVLTTPLVIAHFHRFPTLFLFTNLVAVPLSSIILMMEILLCLVHPLEHLAVLVGEATNALIKHMNEFVTLMGKIPFGSVDNIQISNTMMVFIGFFACACYGLIKFPQKSTFGALLLTGLLLPVCQVAEYSRISRLRSIHILNVNGATAIIHQHGKNAVLTASQSLYNDEIKTKELLHQSAIALGIAHWKMTSFPDQPTIIRIYSSKEGMEWLLLSHAKSLAISQLLDEAGPKVTLIADASTPLWKIKQWEKESQKLHLRFKSTPEQGPIKVCCHQTASYAKTSPLCPDLSLLQRWPRATGKAPQ